METWLITGGTKGLGRALVDTLHRSHRQVVFCSRNQRDVDQLELAFNDSPAVRGFAGSVDDPVFVRSLLEHTIATFGDIHGMIINAAIASPVTDVLDLSITQLQEMLAINVMGALYLLKTTAPYLLSQPHGKILAMTSDASHAAYPGWAGYGMTKAALNLLITTFAKENPSLHTHLVDPGDMDTAMHHLALPDDPGPFRDPIDVAEALLPLINDNRESGCWELIPQTVHQLVLQEVGQ